MSDFETKNSLNESLILLLESLTLKKMTSSIHTVKDAAEQGRGGGCCLGDITAEAGLAGASGDVTHLQAALLSFELRLALGERSRWAESCVV